MTAKEPALEFDQPFGLEQLTSAQITTLGDFFVAAELQIDGNRAKVLIGQFEDEWRGVLSQRPRSGVSGPARVIGMSPARQAPPLAGRPYDSGTPAPHCSSTLASHPRRSHDAWATAWKSSGRYTQAASTATKSGSTG